MSIQKQSWTLIQPNLNLEQSEIYLDEDEHHYAFHVLRLAVGDEVEIVNGHGIKAFGTILSANKKAMQIQINNVTQQNEMRPAVHLWLACPKPSTLEEVIASASELGACAVHVFKSEKAASKAPVKIEKLRKLSLEAMRISKSAFAADIFCYESLSDFYEKHISRQLNLSPNRLVLLCDESHVYEESVSSPGLTGGARFSLCKILQKNIKKETEQVCVLVGPEASFSDSERLFLQEKVKPFSVSLGNNILRVPNAVVCALGAIIMLC